MRSIEVSTDVYAMIWRARQSGEETENDILKRVLYTSERHRIHSLKREAAGEPDAKVISGDPTHQEPAGKIRWVDDVRSALSSLGGKANLHDLYNEVARIRRRGGRTIPRTLEAIVRRTLEDFSMDSANFRGIDLFCMPEGRGEGIWALRISKSSKPPSVIDARQIPENGCV